MSVFLKRAPKRLSWMAFHAATFDRGLWRFLYQEYCYAMDECRRGDRNK